MLSRPHNRRGSLYLAVLGTSVVVSLLALAGMHAARVHLASTVTDAQQPQARLLAASAIELAITQLQADANWLTTYAVDTDYPATPVSAGGGTFVWRLRSAGGTNRTLQGAGTVGDATCTLEVDLAQRPDLSCALLAGGNLTIDSDCEITAEDAPVAVNGSVNNDGVVTANIGAQAIAGAGSVVGTQTAPAALRSLPTPSMVFDYYEKMGTVVTPGVVGTALITTTVLSPKSSWGDKNDDGIYVIDTQGKDLTIFGARIVGTLIVTNLAPGKKVIVNDVVNWEPAYPNYPALLVDGDLEISLRDGDVTEWLLSPSYNPSGTPFQGSEDSDKSDTFISSLAGLVYCSGNLTIKGNGSSVRTPDLRGIFLAGGNCAIQAKTMPVIKYDDTAAITPPPGFTQDANVVIVPGSWRQVTPD